MTAPRLQQAAALVTDVRGALDADGLHKVTATTDAALIPSGARHGVVVVAAPELTFAGPFGDVQAAFELHVIAGPADNYLAAWETIDGIIQALVDGDINLAAGKPGAYAAIDGSTLPAYTLTLNDLD